MDTGIKEKFKLFIDKQRTSFKVSNQSNTSNHQECISSEEFEGRTAVISDKQRIGIFFNEQRLTPEAEKAVIDSIDLIYFEAEGNDVGEHELRKFPDISDIHVINGIRSRLRKQQAVVTRCVSNLILQKQGQCSQEIDRIANIQQEICKSIALCTEGRSRLMQGRTQFTSASLGILSNYIKRQKVAGVIESLKTIQTLQMTDVQLQILLKGEDYPGAINLLMECQKAASTFKHFKCISELSYKLQDTLEETEEQLDSAVSRVALNFNELLYEKLFTAFGLLNKSQIMMDQLHMHLTSHIHNTAFNIILGYVELYNTNSNKSANGNLLASPSFSKLQYAELCKFINEECFLSCFLDISKGMWNILKNYHSIIKWHTQNKFRDRDNDEPGAAKTEVEVHNNYIKQKLDHGLIRLWQDVQAKVRTYILASDLSHFKFDDFLKVLDVINQLIEIGKAFCGSQSETLQDSIKKQSLSFFHSHHSARMDELHMFLENEGWEICPVKSAFNINQLIEYKFLKGDFDTRRLTPISSPKKGLQIGSEIIGIFDTYDHGTPFDIVNDDSLEEDIMADNVTENAISDDDSDDELSEELRRDFVDEQTGEKPVSTVKKKQRDLHKTPMVTNTALTVLRLFGKYIQMMRLLQPIAFDVLLCLCQLFEYYMYAVFSLFTNRSIADPVLSPRLRTTLKRIEETLILNENCTEENRINKVPAPSICPNILNDSPETLYSLPVRVIAVESLSFLSQQLESLQTQIESLIPPTMKTFLQQFYTNTVMMTSEIRGHVYMQVAAKAVDYESLLNQMNAVKWDISDLMSQHNAYVDVLLRQLQILTMRIEELRRCHPIPQEATTTLWECVVRYTHRTLLEGFSSARKCSNEGRSLMQLDYQQFLMKLECLTPIRPLPDRHLVESFIKAYYLPENVVEEWVTANKTFYSTRQLTALTNCMSHVSKRTRQKIAALLEENAILK